MPGPSGTEVLTFATRGLISQPGYHLPARCQSSSKESELDDLWKTEAKHKCHTAVQAEEEPVSSLQEGFE